MTGHDLDAGSVRNLTLLVSAVLFTETLLYAALSPLLPALTQRFGLSKSQAGLLVAAYAFGQVAAALPLVFFVSKAGVKASVVGGLVMLSATSLAFGFATGYGELLGTRLLQGVAGALCWSSGLAWLVEALPRARRGELIGIAMGVSASGLVFGPVFGGIAALAGRGVAFAGIAAIAAALGALVGALPRPVHAPGGLSPGELVTAHGGGQVLLGQGLLLLPGLLIGSLGVLAPLRLYQLGFRTNEIAVTFLLAAATGILIRPLVGRWSDRRGRLAPIRLCLVVAVPIGLAMPWAHDPWLLAALVVGAFTVYETVWGPTVALLADAYEVYGIAQGAGFALMNISSGAGIVVGAAVGGLAAHLVSDFVVYSATAGICLVTFVALRPSQLAENSGKG
ncbi:MAG: MFS transporter [Gaiellaceae bacterium]